MRLVTDDQRFAVVLAAGGERVVAWEVGVLAGLADAGFDPRRAAVVLGTSAGSLVAARLAAGLDPRADADRLAATVPIAAAGAMSGARELFASFAATWEAGGSTVQERRRSLSRLALESSPGGEEELVAQQARRLPAGSWPPALRIVAIDARRGERVTFDASSGVPVARAVAASRAVPVLRPPVTVGGLTCVDGALGSATNADLVSGGDTPLVIVITPTPVDPLAVGPDRLFLAALREEIYELERAGHRVELVHAGEAELAAMGRDPMSAVGAPGAVIAGRARGHALIGSRLLGRAA